MAEVWFLKVMRYYSKIVGVVVGGNNKKVLGPGDEDDDDESKVWDWVLGNIAMGALLFPRARGL